MSRAMQFDIVANDKATGTMQKAEKSMGSFSQKMTGGFAMVAAKAMMVLAVISKLTAQIMDMGRIADEAAKLGLDPNDYDRKRFAMEDYGASIENYAMALKDANKLLDQAATKSGPDRDVLMALGFGQQEIADRAIKAEEVFKRISLAIQQARSEEEKFALASRVVGDRVAQAMLPILANWDKFIAVADRVEGVSTANAKAADDVGTEINLFFKNLGNKIKNFAGDYIRTVAPTTAAQAAPRTPEEIEEGRRRRDALLSTAAKATGPRESNMAVTSLQKIGGGLSGGVPLAEQFAERTAIATETIAETVTQTPPAPTGGTDVTKPEGAGARLAKGMQDAGEALGTAVFNLFK
jgi:hypothetical protein